MTKKKKRAASAAVPKKNIPTAQSAYSGKTVLLSDPDLSPDERAVADAVKEFETAEKVIALFKAKNPELWEEYEALLEEREQKRQAANTLVRSLDVSCGPWDRYTTRTDYYPDKLFQYLGRQKFLDIGGTIGTTSVYSIDPAKIEMAITTGSISRELVPEIKKVVPSFHSPKES